MEAHLMVRVHKEKQTYSIVIPAKNVSGSLQNVKLV